MVKRYLIWAFVIFVAGMLTGFIPKLVHQARLNNALKEYKQAFSERVDLGISHKEELIELAIKARQATLAENTQIKQRLSKIIDENEAADEKLARTKQKFCDLAGEKNPLCQEEQEAAPKGFI
ncbi:MAG: hypothetical protein Q8Q46_02040 [Candidatus Giovannonibacteria bacterium]|nr:hypothetical protein [Candidatus Giovannonibacteria bacterium]